MPVRESKPYVGPFPDDFEVVSRYFPEECGTRPAPHAIDAFRDMFQHSGDWFLGEDDDPYVTYVVVCDRPDTNSEDIGIGEEDAAGAAMIGLMHMLSLYGKDDSVTTRLNQWCSFRIRKVVKRAHGAKWRRIVSDAVSIDEGTGIPGSVLVRGFGPTQAEVLVMAPMRVSWQPASLRRLQVSGLSLDRTVWKAPTSGTALRVMLDDKVDMTSGKVIAQVGHAVQLAFRNLGDSQYRAWAETGFHVEIKRGNVDGARMAMEPDVIVTDAGFTEVRSGTRTCAAWLSNEDIPVVSFE